MSLLLTAGIAVGGGILNALNGSAEDREMEKRKQAALTLLRENIIDPVELDTMLSNINRLFNNRLANTLNSTALRSRGIANSGVVKGIAAGQIESGRLGAISDTEFKALESNKQTRAQMAQTEVQYGSQHNFFGDFAGGALAAAPVGIELSKMLGNATSVIPELAPRAIPGTDTSMDFIGADLFNKLKGQSNDPYRWGKQIPDDETLNYLWNK